MARTTIRCPIEAWVLAILLAWPAAAQPLTFEHMLTLGGQEGVNPHQRFTGRLGKLVFGKPEHVSPVMVPDSVTVDRDERVWITDRAAAGVHMFDVLVDKYKFLQGGGGLNFQCPAGIDSDGAGRIYVVDSCLGWVFIFERDGSFDRFLKTGTALKKPVGIAVSRDRRRIYISDAGRHQILVLNQEGELVSEWGGPEILNYPGTLTLGPNKVFVQDVNRRQVRAFSSLGDDLGPVSWDRPRAPGAFAYDSVSRRYFTTEALFGLVMALDGDGRILGAFSPQAPGEDKLRGVAGLYVDAWGRIYAIDSQNARVVVFREHGGRAPDLRPDRRR